MLFAPPPDGRTTFGRDVTAVSAGTAPTVNPRPAPLVELTGIAVEIEHTPILQDLDFGVGAGRTVGVLGANGSGKSTLLQVIATLRRPSRGIGVVLGVDICSAVPGDVRRQICLVGHQPALYAQMSLRENLRFVADLYGQPVRVVDEALSTVGLLNSAERRVDHCSHGMARRADLARVLISEPALLLLDEAHAGLDPAAADLVAHLVSTVTARGGAAVVVSHERDRLDPFADEIVRVAQGRVHVAGRDTV